MPWGEVLNLLAWPDSQFVTRSVQAHPLLLVVLCMVFVRCVRWAGSGRGMLIVEDRVALLLVKKRHVGLFMSYVMRHAHASMYTCIPCAYVHVHVCSISQEFAPLSLRPL